jgi:hypothetical protein
LLADSMDWPGARELSIRLKKMLPPSLNSDTINTEQLQQENEQLKQQLAQLQEVQMKLASAEKISAEDNATKLQVAQLNAEVSLIKDRTN